MLQDTTAQSAAAGALADALGFGHLRNDFMSAGFWGTPLSQIQGDLLKMRERDDLGAQLASQERIANARMMAENQRRLDDSQDRWGQLVYKTNTESANDRAKNDRMMEFYSQLGNRWDMDRQQKQGLEQMKEAGRGERNTARIDARALDREMRYQREMAKLERYYGQVPESVKATLANKIEIEEMRAGAKTDQQAALFDHQIQMHNDRIAAQLRGQDLNYNLGGRRLDIMENQGGRKLDLQEEQAGRNYALKERQIEIDEAYKKGKMTQAERDLALRELIAGKKIDLDERRFGEQVAGRQGKQDFLTKKLDFWQQNEEANRVSREKIAAMRQQYEYEKGADKLPTIAKENMWREARRLSIGPDGKPDMAKAPIIYREMLGVKMRGRGEGAPDQAAPQAQPEQKPQQSWLQWLLW